MTQVLRASDKGAGLMADDEQTSAGMVPGLVQDIIAQLRGIAEGLQGVARLRDHLPSAPRALALPGTLSAAQLKSIADAVAAQRRSIEALKAQLSSFDEQLAVLEQIIRPLAEWSRKWAELQDRLLNLHPGPKADGGT
jgi:hypothetical protein